LIWSGNQDLKLPTSDMFEVGYRTKIGQHVIVDLEAFHTSTKDYSYFMPDGMTFTADWSKVLLGQSSAPELVNVTGSIKYYNFDLTTVQDGLTCNVSVAINKKFNFRLFGTLQESRLKHLYNRTIWQDFSKMINDPLAADGLALSTNPARAVEIITNPVQNYTSTNPINKDSLINTYNKSTPSFFGGVSVDYTPIEKLSIFTTAYMYSKQSIETNQIDVTNAKGAASMYKVDPKVIISMKISYKVWKETSVYLNARNLFDNYKKEFAYTDKIGGTYLLGLDLNF
jgi:iron complex outermembrane recepter protein